MSTKVSLRYFKYELVDILLLEAGRYCHLLTLGRMLSDDSRIEPYQSSYHAIFNFYICLYNIVCFVFQAI